MRIIKNKKQNGTEYFTKIPNLYTKKNIPDEFNISRKLFIVYVLIDKHRSYEDMSWVSIKKILNCCGYYPKRIRKDKKWYIEIISILNYLQQENIIKIHSDLNEISYDSAIELEIIPENFDVGGDFTQLYSSEFDSITSSTSGVYIENLMAVYLYVKSYIFNRKANNTYNSFELSEEPCSFYQDISRITNNIGLSNKTTITCLDELVSLNLLVKHMTGSCVKKKSGKLHTENVPNIYVLNNANSVKEIELTVNKMKEFYNVDEFTPHTGKDKTKL